MFDLFGSASSFISYLGPFTILIGVLVFVHELGHFLVAKYYGVRVEVFSLGFGKKILKYVKGDTTYCISLIPLGGYVKMYGDDPNKNVPVDEEQYAFLKKPVMQRIAIVLAGPLMNLIFAFFVYLCLAYVGETREAPVVGDLKVESSAYQAGLRPGDSITHINNQPITHWGQIPKLIHPLTDKTIKFSIQRSHSPLVLDIKTEKIENPDIFSDEPHVSWIKGLTSSSKLALIGVSSLDSHAAKSGLQNFDQILTVNGTKVEHFRSLPSLLKPQEQPYTLEVQQFDIDAEEQKAPIRKITFLRTGTEPLKTLGLHNPETFILKLNKEMPAFKAGLKIGDRILSINDQNVTRFEDVLSAVKGFTPERKFLTVKVERNGTVLNKKISPVLDRIKQESKHRYLLGLISATIYAQPKTVIVKQSSLFSAFRFSLDRTWFGTKIIFISLYKMIQNKISPKNLSGILTIGVMAKKSMKMGFSTFLNMMAILSLNLFIINLLPIPVLDGGHLLFFTLEAIKGSPVSMEKMMAAQQVGVFIILGLMLFAFFNDISSLFFSAW